LKYLKGQPQELGNLQTNLSESLNYIIASNKTDLMGYAFQIYALFVASSDSINELYEQLL